MNLVDKEIKEMVEDGKLILSNFCETDLGSVSYDLRIESILTKEGGEKPSYLLNPRENIIVKCSNLIHTPVNIIARILEKNSLLRYGIFVRGTVIQPGHKTYCYLVVENNSSHAFELGKGLAIAHISFEKTSDTPTKTYSEREGSSFVDELEYSGLGRYYMEYQDRTML